MASRISRSLPVGVRQIWDDPPATENAVMLVALGGVARGVGEWSSGGAAELLASTLLALFLWLVAGSLVAALSGYFAPRRIALTLVLRTCALAAAPALVLAIGVAPIPGGLHAALWVAAHLAMTVAFVVAVKRALSVDTTRALFLSVATLVLGLLALLTLEVLLARPPTL